MKRRETMEERMDQRGAYDAAPDHGERVFRCLLTAYPRPFRDRYESELLSFFREQRRRAAGGAAGAVGFWLATLIDLCRSALRQRLRGFLDSGFRGRGPSGQKRGMEMGAMLQDLKYALRTFRRSPGFLFVAVVTLALGIGSTAGIFSVVDGVLIRDLPYPESDRLVAVGAVLHEDRARLGPMSDGHFLDLREGLTTLSNMVVARSREKTLVGQGDPRGITGMEITDGFFELLGERPVIGRSLVEDDFDPIASPVVVLSHAFWREEWGEDRSVLGSTLALDGTAYEIVGVMGPDLIVPSHFGSASTRYWLPMRIDPGGDRVRYRFHLWMGGRLGRGASVESAEAEADALLARVSEAHHPDFRVGARVVSLKEKILGANIGRTLVLFLGAVSLLLVIACANVANLLLARGNDRARELAVRTVLGARKARITGQLLTEGVLIGTMGGLLGVALAHVGVRVFQAWSPGGVPRLAEVSVDLRVLTFAMVASVLTAVLFGLAPALQARRADPAEVIKEGALSSTAGRSRGRLRGSLVVVEIALAMMLLVGAGLFVNSFVRLRAVDPGFEPEGLATVKVSLRGVVERDEWAPFFEQVLERVEAIPGVQSALLTSGMPFTSDGVLTTYTPEGWDPSGPDPGWQAVVYLAGEHLETLRVPLREGREFTPDDREGQPLVAIVNDAWAAKYLPGETTVVGKRVHSGDPDEVDQPWITIVGRVGDMHSRLNADPEPRIYIPLRQDAWRRMSVVARTAEDPASILPAMRRAVWEVDPERAIDRSATVADLARASIVRPRFYTALVSTFAALALTLSVVGIYGTMSYSVSQRTREMGIRIALGAERDRVLGLVVGRGARLAVAGLLLGVGGALASTGLLARFLFGVEPADPVTISSTGLLLLGAALLACYVPARRATRVDPMTTLRSDK